MVDNVTIGGVQYATDDVGGSQYPYSKMAFGPNNTATPVTTTTPMPVVATVEKLLNWDAGVKVTVNGSSVTLITPPAGCNCILIDPSNEVFIRADGDAAADAAGSMRYFSKDIIPVTPGVPVTIWAPVSTVVYAVPYE